jgi:hypothetical protein
MQLDEADRGFAYAQDAPLDMRMDQTTGVSAAEVLNTYPPGELVRILRAYGEEKQAKRIVSAIVREREKEPFTNSARLVELIRDSLPQAAKRTGGNPAKRTFQALRIEVNGELTVLERAIPAAVKALAVGLVELHGGDAQVEEDAVDARDAEPVEDLGQIVVDRVDEGRALAVGGQPLSGEPQRLLVPVEGDESPSGKRRSSASLWPPRPRVQSTTTAPGRSRAGANMSRHRWSITGTCRSLLNAPSQNSAQIRRGRYASAARAGEKLRKSLNVSVNFASL